MKIFYRINSDNFWLIIAKILLTCTVKNDSNDEQVHQWPDKELILCMLEISSLFLLPSMTLRPSSLMTISQTNRLISADLLCQYELDILTK